jgi:RNA polymerase sigma-70 factor (ECF subfamily)
MNEMRQIMEQLIDEHGDLLKRTAYVMLGDAHLAEDLTQETFISFYKSYHRFRGEAGHSTYLYRILMNHIKMHWRKKRPFVTDPSELRTETIVFEDMRVEAMDLENSLRRLKRSYREVLTLYYFIDHSVKEIAEILDLSESNVKMRLKRGREAMKRELTGGGRP